MGKKINPGTSAAVLARDNSQCARCGTAEMLTLHHVLPLSEGGKSTARNLLTLCLRCHDKEHGVLRPNLYHKERLRLEEGRGSTASSFAR